MSSIDNRIVRMTFDNNKFEKGIATTMRSLEKFDKSLEFKDTSRGFEDLTRAANKVDLSNLTRSIDLIKNHFTVLGRFIDRHVDQMIYKVENFGKSIYNQFVKGPRVQGFNEYELKMGSIQTIMNATGESLDTVNRYLEELNAYSDRTIYSFSDMTSNIAKFTNAGVGLNDAVGAIQGISNWAALSGANANEASRAMYNLSQALASGFVRLVDWKSIEYANMATVEVKQTLIDTAKELGVLDDQYQVTTANGKKQKVSIENFNDSLQYQWLTSEVLIKTLGIFSDETTTLGKRAFAAAQDVKTFTQLMDTLKESIGSGWAQSYELIFGDLEEAKQLFTGINNELGSIFGGISDWRNGILKQWKDSGGRTALLGGLKSIWDILKGIGNTIKASFLKVFSSMKTIVDKPLGSVRRIFEATETATSKVFDGLDLTRITKKFEASVKGMLEWLTVIGDDGTSRLGKITKGFEGIFTIVKVVGNTLIGFGSSVWKILSPIVSIVSDVAINAFSDFGQLVTGIYDAFSKSENASRIINSISNAIAHLANGLSKLASFMFGAIGKGAEGVIDWAISLLGNGKNVDRLNENATIVDKVIYLFDQIWGKLKYWHSVISAKLKPYIAPIRDFFTGLWTTVSESFTAQGFQSSMQSGWNYISNFFGGIDFGPIGDKIISIYQTVSNFLNPYLSKISNGLSNAWDKVKSIFAPKQLEDGKTETFVDVLKRLYSEIKTKFMSWWNTSAGFIKNAIGIVRGFFSSIGEGIFNAIAKYSEIKQTEKTNFGSTVSKLWSALTDPIKEWFKNSKKSVSDILTAIRSAFGTFGAWVYEKFSTVGAEISNVWFGIYDFMTKYNILDNFREFFTVLQSLGIAKILLNFGKIGKSISKGLYGILKSTGGVIGSVDRILTVLSDKKKGLPALIKGFTESQNRISKSVAFKNKGQGLLAMAAAIGVLAASLWVISKIDPVRLTDSITVLGGLMLGMAGFSRIVGSGGNTKGMLSMALGLLVLTFVIKKFASMDVETYSDGLLKLVPVLILLAGFNRLNGVNGFKGMFSMAAGLWIIVQVMKDIASMDPEDMGVALFTIIPLLLTLGIVSRMMTKRLKGGATLGKNGGLIGMALSLILIVRAMKQISAMDPESLFTSFLVVETLIITMGIISRLLSKRLESGTGISKSTGAILALGFAINLMVFAMKGVATMDGGSILKGLLTIVTLMTTVGIFTKLTQNGNPASMLAGLASLWGTIMLFVFAMDSLKGYDASSIGTVAASITGLLLGMAGAIFVLSKVPPAGAAKAALSIGAFLGVTGAITALMGAINGWTGGKAAELLNQGAEVLRSIGYSIGSLIDGFNEAFNVTGDYTNVGDQFTTEFATQIKDVGDAGKDIDLEGITTISTAITKLGEAANAIPKEGGIWQRIVGGTDITGFGTGMSGLATSLVTFSENSVGLIKNKKSAMAAIDILGGIVEKVKQIPGTGGLLQKIVGEINIATFAEQLGALGAGLANFAKNSANVDKTETGAGFENLKSMQDSATTMATILGSIVTAVKDIPKEGGLLQNLVGGIDITSFAGKLGALGSGLVAFANSTKGITISNNTTKAIGLISDIGTAATSIPGTGGILQAIVGTHDIGGFGDDMTQLATGLVNFSTAATGITATPEQIDTVVGIITKLGTASESIPDSSWFAKIFGGLHDLGDFSVDIKEFAEGIGELDLKASAVKDFEKLEKIPDLLGKFVDASNKLDANETDGAWIVKLFGGDLTGLTSLGGALTSFATSMVTADESFKDVNVPRIETIIGLLTSMAGAALMLHDAQDSGEDGLNPFKPLIDFTNTLYTQGPTMAENLWDFAEVISTPTSEAAQNAIVVLENAVGDFETAGFNIGAGVARGIRKSIPPVLGAIGSMVNRSLVHMKVGYMIHSPSKVTEEIGRYLDLGLAKGINDHSYNVENGIDKMVSSTRNRFEAIKSVINSVLEDNPYSSPRITPVVDMDNINKTSGAINSMLTNQNGIKINGTLSASLANRISPTVNVATNPNIGLENSIEKMNTRIDELNYAIANMEVVLDSGTLVGKLSAKMDKRLGAITSRKGRG